MQPESYKPLEFTYNNNIHVHVNNSLLKVLTCDETYNKSLKFYYAAPYKECEIFFLLCHQIYLPLNLKCFHI